jgi:hypothetical protein
MRVLFLCSVSRPGSRVRKITAALRAPFPAVEKIRSGGEFAAQGKEFDGTI